eukprot:sb/3466487/
MALVDVIFEEDKGFLAAIVALASIAKRPIVLTSTRSDIQLPTDAEFLILGFQPPKLDAILLTIGSLLLSRESHITAYQLQQYTQYHSLNLLQLVSNIHFLSHRPMFPPHVDQVHLTYHHFGISPRFTCRRTFLEQSRALDLHLSALNLEKLRGNRGDLGERREVLEGVVCRDTFITLDHLRGVGDQGVGVEDQLLTMLGVGKINDRQIRVNEHKWKELKRYREIEEVSQNTTLGLGIFNSRSFEELSASKWYSSNTESHCLLLQVLRWLYTDHIWYLITCSTWYYVNDSTQPNTQPHIFLTSLQQCRKPLVVTPRFKMAVDRSYLVSKYMCYMVLCQ